MVDWIQSVMKNGYIDEHGHKLHGASAVSHFMNRPVGRVSRREIEIGKKFVQKYMDK